MKEPYVLKYPGKDLTNARKVINDALNDHDLIAEIRKYVCVGHDGKRYKHAEVNSVGLLADGVFHSPTDEEIIKTCREIAWREERIKLYAIIEMVNNDPIRIILGRLDWVPLNKFDEMI